MPISTETRICSYLQQYYVTPGGQRFLVNLETGNLDSQITVTD